MRRVLFPIAFLLLCAGAMCLTGSITQPHFKSAHAQLAMTGAGAGAPGGGAWTPASLPGLVWWMSASLGVSQTLGALTAWADQSGNHYDCNTITTVPPTYSATSFNGNPGIDFSALSQMGCNTTAANVSTSSTMSVFVLAEGTNASSTFGRLTGSWNSAVAADSQTPGFDMSVAGSTTNTIHVESSGSIGNGGSNYNYTFNTPSAFGAIADGTNGHAYLNNVEQGSPNSFTTSFWGNTNCFTVGSELTGNCSGSSSAPSFDGTIAEIVVTNNAMSSANRALLETYFVSKGL